MHHPFSSSPHVLQLLPQLNVGGVEESTVAMAKALTARTWHASVASAGGSRVGEIIAAGGTHIMLPLASKNPLVWFWSAYRLHGYILQTNVSIVHARSRAPAWVGWLATRGTPARFVTTFHGTYGLRGGWLKRFYNSIMVAGPHVIANSSYISDHIIDKYHITPHRITIATRGFDETRFNPSLFSPKDRQLLRAELGIPPRTPVLFMSGRLTAWKGQHLLLEALAKLLPIPWVAIFAGGPEGRGHYADDLKGFAHRLGLTERIRWLGHRTDIPALLSLSTLAFSTSIKPEAFGRVAVEAMAMEVPIIASAHGGSLETVLDGATGWLLPVNSRGEITPQALADCIAAALQNPAKLRTMGQRARRHVLHRFTEDQCCQAEMTVYERLIERQWPTIPAISLPTQSQLNKINQAPTKK